MADKIDIRPGLPASRSIPSTSIADRRKKPDDKLKRNKSRPRKRPPTPDDGKPHIDEYV